MMDELFGSIDARVPEAKALASVPGCGNKNLVNTRVRVIIRRGVMEQRIKEDVRLAGLWRRN